jgi:hypothetical protein
MTDQRPNESLHAYLKRRERELVHQITAIHGELAPRERELAEVRQAMAAIGLLSGLPPLSRNASQKPGSALTDAIAPPEAGMVHYGYSTELASFLPGGVVTAATLAMVGSSEQPITIKQLILRALTQFHDGATPAQLRTYIKDAYGREVERVSMGPQLARLRDEGLIEQMAGMLNEGKWNLKLRGEIVNAIDTSEAKSKMYDHPSSKKMGK